MKFLEWVTRENLLENVTFEQRPKGSEMAENVGIWGKSISGRQNSECKLPEVEEQLPGTAKKPL